MRSSPSFAHVLTLALCLFLSPACASGGGKQGGQETGTDLGLAQGNAFTNLLEVRLGSSQEVAGYLVEFEGVPLGIVDDRPYPVGTVLVQDTSLQTLGFLTPRGNGFRFDGDGRSHDEGHGTRIELIARIMNTGEHLRLRAVTP